jgi:general transcription factor 3C polypeptide 3 (transcription factor C subunit 4)
LRHCMNIRSKQEKQIVSNFSKTSDRINELKNLRRNRGEIVEDTDSPEFSTDDEPTMSDDWTFFCELVETAWKHKKYAMLQKIVFAAMSSRRLQSHVWSINLMSVVACLFNKEEFCGYNKIREFHSVNRDMSRFWNLFNLIVYVTQDTRYHRFVMRLFERSSPYTSNIPPPVYLLVVNYYLLNNSYKYAISDYIQIYNRFKMPMVALILAVLYSQIANQKHATRKQCLLLQALKCMEKYATTREPEANAEILYNTGRLYHQIGIVSVAKDYYLRALKATNPMIEKYPEILDLKMEIAYNLHLIYKQSGNRFMARKILYDHIVL